MQAVNDVVYAYIYAKTNLRLFWSLFNVQARPNRYCRPIGQGTARLRERVTLGLTEIQT